MTDPRTAPVRRLTVAVAAVLGLLAAAVPALAVAPRSDAPGNPGTVVDVASDPSAGPSAVRYHGTSRSDTAALIARDGFARATTVLLARQDDFPDSLGGGFLAGQFDAPVLLTRTDRLTDEAAAALDDLDPGRIIVLGGEAAISAEVASAVDGPDRLVERIAGAGRYETSALTATFAGTEIGLLDGARTAIVASGRSFPDALVMSALAAAKGWPLLLTDPATLPSATAQALTDLDVATVLLAGGPAAISTDVEASLAALPGVTVRRLAGADRVATATTIARFATTEAGMSPDVVNLATGRAFPDALALGPLAATDPSPVLLTASANTLGAPLETWVDRLACVAMVRVSGGPGAIDDDVLTDVRRRTADATTCTTRCDDDAADGGTGDDRRATARLLDRTATGTSCPGDEDWFALPSTTALGDTVVVEVATSGAGIVLQHLDADDGLVATAPTDLRVPVLGRDDRVRVRATGAVPREGTPYALATTAVAPDCDTDPFDGVLVLPDEDTTVVHGARCPGDPAESFTTAFLGGDLVQVTAERADGSAALPVRLVDAAGRTQGDLAEPTRIPAVGAPWTVALDAGEDVGAYALTIVAERAGCGGEQATEPDDTFADATVLSSSQPSAIRDGLCGDDVDWSRVPVLPGQTLDVHVTHEDDAAPTVTLHDGETLVATADTDGSGVTALTATVDRQPTDDAGIRLASTADVNYALTTSVADPTCPDDDVFEPNDSRAAGNGVVRAGGVVVGVDCGEGDWYAIDAIAGDRLVIDTSTMPDTAAYLVDLGRTAEGGNAFTALAGTTASFALTPSTRFTPAIGSMSGPYRFDVVVDHPNCATNDPFEDDDTVADATPLVGGDVLAGVLCDDVDGFQVTLEPGETAVWDVTGDATLTLVDDLDELATFRRTVLPDGTVRTWATNWRDTTRTSTVQLTGPRDTTYRLAVDVRLSDCPGATTEPNDNPRTPHTDAAFGAGVGGQLCNADVHDWFELGPVANGETVRVDLAFAHEDGNLDLELTDEAFTTLATADSTTDNETLTHTATRDLPRVFVLVRRTRSANLTIDYSMIFRPLSGP